MGKPYSIIDNVTEDKLKKVVKEARSYRQVLLVLGYCVAGGNYETIKKLIKKYGIDISHFDGNGWNKGKNSSITPLSEILKKNSTYSRYALKSRLLKECLLKNKCYICGLENQWNNQNLILVLDHINGDKYDNRIENLRMLCPNCNSQTKTFCRSNGNMGEEQIEERILDIKEKNRIQEILSEEKQKVEKNDIKKPEPLPNKKCPICKKMFKMRRRTQKYCSSECYYKDSRKVERPNKCQLKKEISENSWLALGRKYGVSGNTIKKWAKKYGIL